MSACFVTDMGTALALSAIFIKPNAWFPVFLVVSVGLILLVPKVAPWLEDDRAPGGRTPAGPLPQPVPIGERA